MTIPDEALDGRLGIVGLTGSGKSNVAKVGVERLLDLGRRVCVVDLLDGWWGLRLKRDGKHPAYPVAIFGGRHGDLPLNEHAGAIIGQAVALSQESAVVVLSELDDDAARRRFAAAFFTALHKHNRAPLHLVIDEADFYAPQNVVKEGPGAILLNRVKEIAARGRMRGFRSWLVTQRPAKLHKDALSQCDTLVAMQLTASQDRKAIEGWIGDQADAVTGKQILATLPRLQTGMGVLWSPRLDILRPQQFPLASTYDSGRTPGYGDDRPDVDLAPLDLSDLRTRMDAVVADAKANDPALLKAEIAKLKREVKAPTAAVVDRALVELVRQEGHDDGRASALAIIREFAPKAAELRVQAASCLQAVDASVKFAKHANELAADMEAHVLRAFEVFNAPPQARQQPRRTVAPVQARQARVVAQHRPVGDAEGAKLSKPARAFLTVLAQQQRTLTRNQLAVFGGYAATSGGVDTALSTLRVAGYVEGPGSGIAITGAGLEALGPYEALPIGPALREYWYGQLDKASATFLRILCDAYPRTMTRNEVAEAGGYATTSGGVDTALSNLRVRTLVVGGGKAIQASKDLFPHDPV